jgi:hypothetical protein
MLTGQSDGCLSTVWCQPRCVMVKTRTAQRNTDANSGHSTTKGRPADERVSLTDHWHSRSRLPPAHG